MGNGQTSSGAYDRGEYRRARRKRAALERLGLLVDYDGPMTSRGLPVALGDWILQRWMGDTSCSSTEKWGRLLDVLGACPEVAERDLGVAVGEPVLSHEARRVLYLLSVGFAPKQIAALDGVSLEAVKQRTRSARRQLSAANTTHAVALAVRRGLLWH